MAAAVPGNDGAPHWTGTPEQNEYYQQHSDPKVHIDDRKSQPFPLLRGHRMLLKRLSMSYTRWKLKLVEQAVTRHTQVLPSVEALEDQSLLDLYDEILGALAGPRTVRVRAAPTLAAALRLRACQRAFSQTVYHQQQIAKLNRLP